MLSWTCKLWAWAHLNTDVVTRSELEQNAVQVRQTKRKRKWGGEWNRGSRVVLGKNAASFRASVKVSVWADDGAHLLHCRCKKNAFFVCRWESMCACVVVCLTMESEWLQAIHKCNTGAVEVMFQPLWQSSYQISWKSDIKCHLNHTQIIIYLLIFIRGYAFGLVLPSFYVVTLWPVKGSSCKCRIKKHNPHSTWRATALSSTKRI